MPAGYESSGGKGSLATSAPCSGCAAGGTVSVQCNGGSVHWLCHLLAKAFGPTLCDCSTRRS